ncbi:LRR receptor kinase SERK2-like [Quercus suber]|uniref:LRR receptor kinase SERK2-like n=1 Tax=Quercus suber TaxID=58331 RepID=UPI0032DF6B68
MEKTDVFDFGRFLLELLTGEDSLKISRLTTGEDTTLVAYIHNRAQGSCINEIVDPAILAEGGASLQHQLQAVADLALTCTVNDPQRRPTVVDVTKQLRRIESFDLIKSIVSPPAHVLREQVTKEQFVLMAAKIMDHIWSLRNQVGFENKKINFQAIPFQNFTEI